MSNLYDGTNHEYFNADYFETGTMTGKSCYTYYRWMPEPTFRMAMALIEYAGIKKEESVLDYGCAKGFLVKALRCLFRDAYGCDISKYAIDNSDPEVRKYIKLCTYENLVPFDQNFSLSIAKDVLEHVPYSQILPLLSALRKKSDRLLSVVPLAKHSKYIIEAYELDGSHIIREDIEWWKNKFIEAGFKIISIESHVEGIKDNWYKINPLGNAVFYVG